MEAKLVLLVELGSEVEEDSTRFKHVESVVGDRRNTSIGVNFQEPRRFDLVVDLANVSVRNGHLDDLVRNTELLKED